MIFGIRSDINIKKKIKNNLNKYQNNVKI